MKKTAFLALAGIAASAAAAQADAPRDPLDGAARVPAIEYRSAFEGYQPFRDAPVTPWRDANDRVKALGGHAGHVKPRSGGSAPPAGDAGLAKEAKPTTGHEGHHR